MAENNRILMIVEGVEAKHRVPNMHSFLEVVGFDKIAMLSENMRGSRYDKVLIPLSMKESDKHAAVLEIVKPMVLVAGDANVRIIYY